MPPTFRAEYAGIAMNAARSPRAKYILIAAPYLYLTFQHSTLSKLKQKRSLSGYALLKADKWRQNLLERRSRSFQEFDFFLAGIPTEHCVAVRVTTETVDYGLMSQFEIKIRLQPVFRKKLGRNLVNLP